MVKILIKKLKIINRREIINKRDKMTDLEKYDFTKWTDIYYKKEKLDLIAHLKSKSWRPIFDKLKDKLDKPERLLLKCAQYNKIDFFPYPRYIFSAFNLTPFEKIKVVIIGQDPYPGFDILEDRKVPHAMGMSFSVPEGVEIPSSLDNIYKNAIKFGHMHKYPKHGNLEFWARQGCLLLNTVMSIQEKVKLSHDGIWNDFTDSIIKYISDNTENCIFVLWGGHAFSKNSLIDTTTHKAHRILVSSHPSGLSCHKGFGSYPAFNDYDVFGEINKILKENKKRPIHWQIY